MVTVSAPYTKQGGDVATYKWHEANLIYDAYFSEIHCIGYEEEDGDLKKKEVL